MRRAARLLLIAGTIAAVIGLSKVHAAWVADDPYDYTGSSRFAWSIAYTGLLLAAAYGAGLPDLVRGRAALAAGAGSTGAAALVISAIQLVTGDALLPRFVVFGSAVLLAGWYGVCAAISSSGRARAEGRDRVVVVGTPEVVDDLRAELVRAPEHPAQLVASFEVHDARTGRRTSKPLVEATVVHRASVVVLDRDAQVDESIVAQAAALHEAGVRIRTLSLFYEEWLGKLPISELERTSLMFDIGELHRARYGRAKRIADLALGIIGLAAVVVLLPIVAAGNVAANRGPLFYVQERTGRWGRPFRIYKFRTMRPRADGLVDEWTERNDPRITPFGRLLRTTHLDELPQMLNVLAGDLSIVGPRPEQPHYVSELSEKIPFYGLRHSVRPGLTGWAQVKYGYAGSERDALEKLQYDFYYLRHQGLHLDARIIARTVRSVLGGEGR